MKRILFVDDEPNVLDGLRRMLRPWRHEWEADFATSGPEALEKLAAEPFDVLVTDMRMPGMDGPELLRRAAEQYPNVVRMALSGQTDPTQVLRSVGLIHQFIAKPCEATALRSVLQRTFALQNLLLQDNLRRLISRTRSLPSLPSLYVDLMEALRDPKSSAANIGRIIARDPGMTAKILQLVNSAFFALRRRISSPEEAVAVLGLETLRVLVLTVQVFSQFDPGVARGFSIEDVVRHSTAVGTMARSIARAESVASHQRDDAFLAGMLHDVGKMVLGANRPDTYGRMIGTARKEQLDIVTAETKTFGGSHAEVGGYLLGIWGLPSPVVEAVAYHHDPQRSLMSGFEPLVAVHVANVCENDRHTPAIPRSTPLVDEPWLDSLGVRDRLAVWREICQASPQ